MQENAFDGSKLIVSWSRHEQGLMKRYLLECANSNDIYCFGDQEETTQLYNKLVHHGFPEEKYDVCGYERAVNHIKKLINLNLKPTKDKNGEYNYSWINNEEETRFLTSFAMAILDTKKRQTYFPGQNCRVVQDLDGVEKMYFGAVEHNNYISIPKLKLLTLATQLSRIGINCKTTARFSSNMRNPATQAEMKTQYKNITLIATNNYLDMEGLDRNITAGNFSNLGIGMNGVNYYVQLYRKLFDFALKKMYEDWKNDKGLRLPEFTIPLGGAWGTKLNDYIFAALNIVLGERYDRTFNTKDLRFKDLIKIKFIDTKKNGNYRIQDFIYKNQGQPANYENIYGEHIDVYDFNEKDVLFADDTREHYVIMAGDHCTFLGNEALENGLNNGTKCLITNGKINNNSDYNNSSMEGFNMKTDFHKFYGQGYGDDTGINGIKCGFNRNNGAWVSNPERLNMPTRYILHMNYQQDKMVEVDEKRDIFQEINNRPVSNNIKTVKKNRVIIR